MDKVSILDLTAGQMETVEKAIGLPMSKWSETPSEAALIVQILAAATDKPAEHYSSMTLRQLNDLVDMNPDEEDAGNA